MITESRIDPESSLGALVAEHPARAALFDDLRLDFCCAGHRTLAEACTQRRVPLAEVLEVLHAIDRSAAQRPGFDRDLRQHIHEENDILFPRVRAAD